MNEINRKRKATEELRKTLESENQTETGIKKPMKFIRQKDLIELQKREHEEAQRKLDLEREEKKQKQEIEEQLLQQQKEIHDAALKAETLAYNKKSNNSITPQTSIAEKSSEIVVNLNENEDTFIHEKIDEAIDAELLLADDEVIDNTTTIDNNNRDSDDDNSVKNDSNANNYDFKILYSKLPNYSSEKIIYKYFHNLLKQWEYDLSQRDPFEKNSAKGENDTSIYKKSKGL